MLVFNQHPSCFPTACFLQVFASCAQVSLTYLFLGCFLQNDSALGVAFVFPLVFSAFPWRLGCLFSISALWQSFWIGLPVPFCLHLVLPRYSHRSGFHHGIVSSGLLPNHCLSCNVFLVVLCFPSGYPSVSSEVRYLFPLRTTWFFGPVYPLLFVSFGLYSRAYFRNTRAVALGSCILSVYLRRRADLV